MQCLILLRLLSSSYSFQPYPIGTVLWNHFFQWSLLVAGIAGKNVTHCSKKLNHFWVPTRKRLGALFIKIKHKLYQDWLNHFIFLWWLRSLMILSTNWHMCSLFLINAYTLTFISLISYLTVLTFLPSWRFTTIHCRIYKSAMLVSAVTLLLFIFSLFLKTEAF